MKPIEPTGLPGQRVVLAENQDQYENLIAHTTGEQVYTRWSLDEIERRAILDGAAVELITWTFGQRFQPVYLRVQGVEERSVVSGMSAHTVDLDLDLGDQHVTGNLSLGVSLRRGQDCSLSEVQEHVLRFVLDLGPGSHCLVLLVLVG